jgi:hypothetical protein
LKANVQEVNTQKVVWANALAVRQAALHLPEAQTAAFATLVRMQLLLAPLNAQSAGQASTKQRTRALSASSVERMRSLSAVAPAQYEVVFVNRVSTIAQVKILAFVS